MIVIDILKDYKYSKAQREFFKVEKCQGTSCLFYLSSAHSSQPTYQACEMGNNILRNPVKKTTYTSTCL